MKGLGSLINRAVLIAGILGIIYPAFIEGPAGQSPPSLTQAIFSLFLEPKMELGYAMRLLCLFVVVAVGYIVLTDWWYRKLPITIVQTQVKIRFSRDHRVVVLERNQVLRANQSGVSAYFGHVAPTDSGTTPRAAIEMRAHCHGCDLTAGHTRIRGTDIRGHEIIQDFGTEIPYTWYMPLVPPFLLKKELTQMLRIFRNNLVSRWQRAVYIDDFIGESPSMSFIAASYPQRNVLIEAEFDGEVPDTFYVIRIRSQAVVKVPYEQPNKNSVRIYMDRLDSETLRLGWENPKPIQVAAPATSETPAPVGAAS